jgi:hypothetical protein
MLFYPYTHALVAIVSRRLVLAPEVYLEAPGIPFTGVSPAVWMQKLGALPKEKAERKRTIREDPMPALRSLPKADDLPNATPSFSLRPDWARVERMTVRRSTDSLATAIVPG